VLAIKAARPARYLAAIANARGRGITRQFRELQRGRARRPEYFFANRRRRLFFSIELFFAIYCSSPLRV